METFLTSTWRGEFQFREMLVMIPVWETKNRLKHWTKTREPRERARFSLEIHASEAQYTLVGWLDGLSKLNTACFVPQITHFPLAAVCPITVETKRVYGEGLAPLLNRRRRAPPLRGAAGLSANRPLYRIEPINRRITHSPCTVYDDKPRQFIDP